LRQIRRVAKIGKACDQDGRQRGLLVTENGPRLFQISRRKAKLVDQCRREHMRVVRPYGVCLQRVMNTKGGKIRNAAEKIERVIGGVAIELVLDKYFVRRGD